MAEHKVDSKLIHAVNPDVCGDPNTRNPGNGTYNGESGYPKRTGSSTALPEKTLDDAGGFGKAGRGEG